jgi:hypothetical protein
MSLIQFINTLGEALEEGDVVVVASKQSSLQGNPEGVPIPEVDLTDTVYDQRVCGIVSSVRIELKPPTPEDTLPAPEDAKAGAKNKKASKTKGVEQPSETTTQPQAATIEAVSEIDHTRVETGQIGFMQTHGAFLNCKVDADIAPIEIGDLLTTSTTRGHAQRVIDPTKAAGAIVGKALGALKKGKGKIPVIVTL